MMEKQFEEHSMDWLQRYVDNVRTYLPARLREDVGNELYSGLQDQCDELQESLGRAPTEDEVLVLLKEKGHPMAVAAGYQSRRTLVSESLFPVYLQVLKWTLMVIAVVSAIDVVASFASSAEPNLIGAAISWLAGLYESGIHSFAWVTLVFYLVGESQNYRKVFANWNPRSLPRIADGGRRIQRFDSAVEFVVTLLALAWLNDIWLLPGPSVGAALTFSGAFGALLPWLNIALAGSVLMSLVTLLSPYWTQPRLLIDIGLNIYWLVLLALLINIFPPFSITWNGGENWQPNQASWQVGVGIVTAITAWDLLKNLRVLMRVWAEQRAL
ncbi:hypothetical protein [Microbulbifer hydrolyticus]|uniref:Uncharacterized protein n=1 Tax=Microbulbifer hydrolyticus TaxID=48074 RepID=A0A6P1TB78_9GAMM|nr:hypothetical protein [Microbulbifer hydrolyticus]MBB5213205.1 hypothetical protein [Microbulbifer hydrolyticus]QHQ38529.1 hypothetical protein GTQ55_05655 [Microbulbifer hydrolyticus]